MSNIIDNNPKSNINIDSNETMADLEHNELEKKKKGNGKSVCELQQDLDDFLKKNRNNLGSYKEAYNIFERARKFLNYHWSGGSAKIGTYRFRLSWTNINLMGFANEEEVYQHYKRILENNRELANKHKTILNLEAAIRKKKHQDYEDSYCGDKECKRRICINERTRIMKKEAMKI